MKKILLLIVVAVTSMTAGAQIYVGGNFGYWREWQEGANKTDLSIYPEIGYNLNEKWAIGATFGYDYNYKKGNKTNGLGIEPYVRYTYASLGPVNLFVDGYGGFYTYKNKKNGVTGDAQNAWCLGLTPGVKVTLTERLSFYSYFGFLGYCDADEEEVFGQKGFGLDLNSNKLRIGLLYNF